MTGLDYDEATVDIMGAVEYLRSLGCKKNRSFRFWHGWSFNLMDFGIVC